MEFALPDEHRMIRRTVREFCQQEIEPIAQEIEDDHRFPAEIFDQLADLDVMGVPIDEEYGGLGGDTLMYALVAEELGRVSGSIGLSYVAHTSLASKPIELFGTAEQKERWLRPLAEGEYLGGWALTEPESGSDASNMDTTAEKREARSATERSGETVEKREARSATERSGETVEKREARSATERSGETVEKREARNASERSGETPKNDSAEQRSAGPSEITASEDGDEWVLNGTKQFITNASIAGSILVKAVTDPDAGYEGISTFIVDPREDDGFEVTTVWEKMGLNASPTCEIRFEDVRLPADRLLGEEGEGWKQTMKTLDGGRISIAALSTGLAQGAYDAAKDYGQEREQFGRPICEFDAVRDTIVDMHRKVERARLLTYRAARTYDAGEPVTRESALAKLDASEAAREVAEDAVQVLGGYGYTTDFAPQRFYRDAKLMEIGEGTSEIQHLVIGRELGL